ncbi:MAG TPA: response regulator [Candidatus Paceibacterota bacterium]
MTNTHDTKGSVLLVDDDKFLADVYSMKFSRAGYTVHACLSVKDALSVLEKGFEPDAVVLDIVMREQDGFVFLDAIQKKGLCKKAALIALTNQDSALERGKAEQMGCCQYIIKGSTVPSELVELVGKEIAKR